jgi:hypothetical protein
VLELVGESEQELVLVPVLVWVVEFLVPVMVRDLVMEEEAVVQVIVQDWDKS